MFISSDWTVVQMTMVTPDALTSEWGHVLVTRLTPHLQPLTCGIPWSRMKYLRMCLKVFQSAIQLDDPYSFTPQEYWKYRHHKDLQMKVGNDRVFNYCIHFRHDTFQVFA